MTRASILVPSHNRPHTLALAVGSALAQTVDDLEVIIIGDGVTDEVRTAAHGLASDDPRVVFLDLPKGENHGEVHRDTAIRAARSDAILYLCDDDLLLPEHVADLLELLGSGHTFVQSLNGHVDPEGRIHRYPGSLSDPEAVAWLLRDELRYNFVSITGTGHSRRFYLELGRPWSTTPAGEWPDLHQWRKMVGRPGFSGATSTRMTALQFPASQPERNGWDEARQLDELQTWAAFVREPGAQDRIDRRVGQSTEAALTRTTGELISAAAALRESERLAAELISVTAALRESERLAAELRATVSWRITRPLRAVRRRF